MWTGGTTKVVIAVLAGAACTAIGANKVRLDYTTDGTGEQGFRMDLGANGSWDYVTFCVEIDETFSPGTVYEYNVSKAVKYNGGGGGINFDTTTGHTIAYVFDTFHRLGEAGVRSLDSDLSGLSNPATREVVQRMIWHQLYGGYLGSYATEISELWNAAFGKWDNLHNVRVANLWEDAELETGPHQDMIIVIPMPAPAGLAGVGLLGLVAARRRR